MGEDRVLSFEDTCNFTCNPGYELTGNTNNTRICQSNGRWSGTSDVCRRGIVFTTVLEEFSFCSTAVLQGYVYVCKFFEYTLCIIIVFVKTLHVHVFYIALQKS